MSEHKQSVEHTCFGAIFCGVPSDVARGECFACQDASDAAVEQR